MSDEPMELSDRGLVELASHEWIAASPYLDLVGVWTYGVGHTASAGFPDPAAMPRGMPPSIDAAVDDALRIFREDVKKFERRVNDAITVPLKQHEFDALVSFDFNTGGIYRAKLTKAINAGDSNAGRHFMGWLKPIKIKDRRDAEMKLFKTGVYSSSAKGVPVVSATDDGKVIWTPITVLPSAELLARMGAPVLIPHPDPAEQPAGFFAAIFAALAAIVGGKRT